MGTDRPDVLVIGAGSAGCVVAERLSRDPRRRVVVLEAGPARVADRRLAVLPIDAASSHVRGYQATEPRLVVVRGRGLGGSSAVNGGYFLRWHDDDLAVLSERAGCSPQRLERAYADFDGPAGVMAAAPWTDAELTDVGVAFERYWGERVDRRRVDDRRPVIGLNRVISNRIRRQRVSAYDAVLAPAADRPNLTVRTDVVVHGLGVSGGRVSGVRGRVGSTELAIDAAEVVLCAGTLGSAALLFDAGVVAPRLPVVEHREVLVTYRRRVPGPLPPTVLQSVVHTGDGCEIRCYTDDFARFVAGVPASSPAIGIAAMAPGVTGELGRGEGGLRVDLGGADVGSWPGSDAVRRQVAAVVDMLHAPEFESVVEPESIVVQSVPSTSQHACATLPIGGSLVDVAGAVREVTGLRVIDGSILSHAGRSGPHATVMMLAAVVADTLIG